MSNTKTSSNLNITPKTHPHLSPAQLPGDKAMSPEELGSAHEQGPTRRGSGGLSDELFDAMDTNRDGVLTREAHAPDDEPDPDAGTDAHPDANTLTLMHTLMLTH